MADAILEWIRWLLLAAAAFLNQLFALLAGKFASEPRFREGFIAALILGLVIGTASRYILYWRKQIQDFFRPPVFILQSRGPTPAQSYASCIGAVAKIGLFTVLILILLIAMLTEGLTS